MTMMPGDGQQPPEDATYSFTAPEPPTKPAYRRTGKKLATLLTDYRQQLEASRKWRKEEGYEDSWRLMIDLYRGKHFTSADLSKEDKIMVNVAFSTANVIGPSVSINRPKIAVNPRRSEFAQAATIAESAVNYWWSRYRFQSEVRRSVNDYVIVGHGWVKVGYRYEEGEQPIDPQTQAAMFAQARDQANQSAAADPNNVESLPTDEAIAESIPTTTTVVTEDRPFVERVSPFDMFVDPEAVSMENARWVAQRIVLPLDEIRNNDNYDPTVRNKLQADAATNPRWRDSRDAKASAQQYDDRIKRVTIWEFYDLRNGLMSVFPEKGDGFLLKPTDMPYVYGCPFVMLRNYSVPDQFYPIGDLEMLEPIQREINELRSQMMNHRKRYLRKYIARHKALDSDAMAALESDVDNAIVYIEDDIPLSDVIAPLPITMTPPEFYNYSHVIENDMDLITAVSEYQRGSVSEVRRTATEASMIQDAVNARSADKLSAIEGWLSDIAARVVQLAQEFLTGEDTVRTVGPLQAQVWTNFTRSEIQGEFDFEVEAGSTQPMNDTQRRQTALQLAQVLSPYVGMAVNPIELARYVLEEGYGIKDPQRFLLNPQPTLDPASGQPYDPHALAQQQSAMGRPNGDVGLDPMSLPSPGPNTEPMQQAAMNKLGGVDISLPLTGG